MSIPPKESPSSPKPRNDRLDASHAKKPLKWLGPSDEIPDIGFPAFLQIMHNHCSELVYSREAAHYARFRRKNDNPADPDLQTWPIIAREQGTVVGHEDIEGLLDEFGISHQRFRDGCNAFYGNVEPEHAP